MGCVSPKYIRLYIYPRNAYINYFDHWHRYWHCGCIINASSACHVFNIAFMYLFMY